uniref:Uncharacterized protein n=1 Tax=Lotus japonicus TaxID=34305 RepID=I3T9U4_LOTJA|nr:unknown [Lotus japonicus]
MKKIRMVWVNWVSAFRVCRSKMRALLPYQQKTIVFFICLRLIQFQATTQVSSPRRLGLSPPLHTCCHYAFINVR